MSTTGASIATPGWLAAAPAGLLAAVLLLATWLDGAFDVRYWAPITVLALIVLASMLFAGGLSLPRSRALLAALGSFWAFSAWTLLSALWAESAGDALEGGIRTLLYAALTTIGLLTLPERVLRKRITAALVAGVTLIGLVTLVQLLADGSDLFLAGRLNEPIGYRNGTAALFAFAVWPLVGLAAQRGPSPMLRAASFAGGVMVLGLIFLTQSRGVVIGLVAGGVVFFAIGPDRLRRAWTAIFAVIAVAIASGSLARPYEAFQDDPTRVDVGSIEGAAEGLGLLVLLAGAFWLFVAIFDNGERTSATLDSVGRRVATAALGAVVLAGAIGALIAIGNPVSYVEAKVDEFKELEPAAPTGSTRVGSVGGQRYDLWRVALEEFKANPLGGVGESNYDFDYYRLRTTDRNLSDAHSLPFRLLAETGLIGTLLFAAFAISLAICVARNARASRSNDRRWIAAAAAAGTTVVAQTSTDWLWLLPSLLGLAFLALSLAAPSGDFESGSRPSSKRPMRLALGTVLALGAVAALLFYLSDLYIRKARAHAPIEPQRALEEARTAGDLNPASVAPLYLEASALETQGDRSGAREALLDALAKEPENFVTLGLLGDLEVRAGRLRLARSYYRRALELNPQDTGIRELAEST